MHSLEATASADSPAGDGESLQGSISWDDVCRLPTDVLFAVYLSRDCIEVCSQNRLVE